MTFPSSDLVPGYHLYKAQTARAVQDYIDSFAQGGLILLDIDDTLITPVSKSFRSPSTGKVKNLIDDIKAHKQEIPDYEAIISAWRLQRQVRLTDPQWPEVLDQLKKQHTVYALTQMDTGAFGSISSMADWRYKELRAMGLTFSSMPEDRLRAPTTSQDPQFYQGIMMTGALSKAATLQTFKKNLPSSKLVMVDDRLGHLEDIAALCAKEKRSFLGILYQEEGAAEAPLQDPAILALQKKTLLAQHVWLEDEEATKILSP